MAISTDPPRDILIVEDSPVEAELLRRSLDRAGYRVTVAKNGEEGLQAARAHRPDLVMSDIRMPLMDGYELCREIKSDNELWNIPVILLTVLSEPEDIMEAINSGADSYIVKPFVEVTLWERIRALLATPNHRKRTEERRSEETEYNGKRYTITGGSQQILNLLLSVYENTLNQNRELTKIQTQLNLLNDSLEEQVRERTAALAESEEKLHTAMETARDAIVMVEAEHGTITEWNHAAEAIFGYSKEEAIGRCAHEFLSPPRFRETARHGMEHFAKTGGGEVVGTTLELMVLRKDGTEFPIELSLSAMQIHGKWHATGIARDISERKRVEAELKLFRTLIDYSSDTIEVFDPATLQILDMNEKGCRDLGYSREELLSMRIYDIDPTLNQASRSKIEEEARRSGTAIFETLHRRKDGSVFPVEISMKLIELDKTYGLAIARDITVRRQAEETLRQSEEKFRALVESTSDWIWEVDQNDRYTYVSPKVEALLGYKPDEVMGKSPMDFLAPEDVQRVSNVFGQASAARAPLVALENINLHKDGRKVIVETSGVPFFDAHGEFVGYRGIDRDITGRKQAEERLYRINRALKALSACNAILIHAQTETKLFDDMCRVIVEHGGYRFVWIGMIEHDEAKSVRPVAHAGFDDDYLESRQMITWADTEHGRGPTGRAVRSGTPQVVRDIETDPHYEPWRKEALKRGYASSSSLPLKDKKGEVFGVLVVYAAEADAFDEEEMRLLTELADDLAFGIMTLQTRGERDRAIDGERAQAVKLHQALKETIAAIALTLEKRDPYTAGHQQRVAEIASAIAAEMGLAPQQIEGIHFGSLIHDIGKVYVPAEILSRPGKLSELEFKLIKTHPQVGYDIVKDIPFPWPVAQMVLQHHERLDGSGYPQGLKGEEIVLEARILMVADIVEAISAHRPYRAAMGIEVAMKEVEQGRATTLDPDVVDACLRVIKEKGFAFTKA